jgi:hypothetical protein
MQVIPSLICYSSNISLLLSLQNIHPPHTHTYIYIYVSIPGCVATGSWKGVRVNFVFLCMCVRVHFISYNWLSFVFIIFTIDFFLTPLNLYLFIYIHLTIPSHHGIIEVAFTSRNTNDSRGERARSRSL